MIAERRPRQAWGKTDNTGGSHPLVHHSMDVAAVFLRMLQLPVIRNRLEVAAQRPLTSVDCERLAALAFLHDIGKLHPGFQAKGWPDGLWTRPVRGHSQESWAFLQLAARWPEHPFHGTMQRLMRWGRAFKPLIGAMFAHHGRPVERPGDPTLQDWDRPRLQHYDWRSEAAAMEHALCRWFPRAFDEAEPLPDHAPLHHAVAGYAALADWIGSDTRFFKYVEPRRADYDTNAHRAAEQALAGMGLDARFAAPGDAPEFDQLTQFAKPNPAQAAVGSVGPETRLVILESETGSGKTEAALWRFTQLLAAGKVSAMYFAVPTRAAARQLHGRVQKAMDRVFGASAPEVVLAIPGILKAGEHEGQRLPHPGDVNARVGSSPRNGRGAGRQGRGQRRLAAILAARGVRGIAVGTRAVATSRAAGDDSSVASSDSCQLPRDALSNGRASRAMRWQQLSCVLSVSAPPVRSC